MAKKFLQSSKFFHFIAWLDVFAITAWGILLLKYWLTEKLVLLVHPRYFWLVITTGVALLFIALFKAWGLWRKHPTPQVQHLSLFPPGWASVLLLVIALVGLVVIPRPLTSYAANQQNITDFSIAATRNRAQMPTLSRYSSSLVLKKIHNNAQLRTFQNIYDAPLYFWSIPEPAPANCSHSCFS